MRADEAHRLESVCGAPILVVGAPRSGTTLVQRTLLADPRCCGGQESHFFVSFGQVLRDFDRKRAMERAHGLACYWRRDDLVARIRALWSETMSGVVAASPGAGLLIEKTPDHALWLDVIAEVLPDARVVHVVRDSRAVCASLLAASRAPWGRAWAPRSAAAAARIWRAHVDAAERCTLPVHRVHFEELEREPLAVLRGLWSFAGLGASDEALLACHRAARSGEAAFVGTGEIARSAPEPAGFHRGADERAQLGWLDRRRVWRETGDVMLRLGYSQSRPGARA